MDYGEVRVVEKIRCSSLGRFFACGGFVTLDRILPKDDQPYASEGTRLHKLLEDAILSGDHSQVPEEYQAYVDYCDDMKEQGWEVHVEKFGENDLIKGTADVVAYKDDKMIILDLKTGFMPVEPTCEQLRGYALLNMREETKGISCKIFQDKKFKSHYYNSWELMDFYDDIKRRDKSKLNMGGHCQFCERVCPEQHKAVGAVFGHDLNIPTLAFYEADIKKYMNQCLKSLPEEAPEGYEYNVKTKTKRHIISPNVPDSIKKEGVRITLGALDDAFNCAYITQEEYDNCIRTEISHEKILVRKDPEIDINDNSETIGDSYNE